MKAAIDRLQWDDDRVTLDGTRFRVGYGPGVQAGAEELLLMKPRPLVEHYVELVEALRPQRIFELGIWLGGSVAFLTLLAKPDKLVAIDIRPAASKKFGTWLDSRDDVVRPYFSVDQADATTVSRIVADEFAGAPLDLVIDDASHLLGPTRASFNVLFPLLRPGGVYVIEDWGEQHEYERLMAEDPAVDDHVRRAAAIQPELWERMPLTRLVFEIALASVYTDLIAEIQIRPPGWLSVTRGFAQVDTEVFDVAGCYLSLGRRVLGDAPASSD